MPLKLISHLHRRDLRLLQIARLTERVDSLTSQLERTEAEAKSLKRNEELFKTELKVLREENDKLRQRHLTWDIQKQQSKSERLIHGTALC